MMREVVSPYIPWPVKEIVRTVRAEWKGIGARSRWRALARSRRPILLGPWVSEMGFEILYWIPFLRWALREFGIPSERVIAVSRGGTEAWYHGLAGRYVDLFDLVTPDEFRRQNHERIRDQGGQKHRAVTIFDCKIYARVKDRLGLDGAGWIHPAVMYNLFSAFWDGTRSWRYVERFASYERFIPRGGRREDLPDRYVAAKFYFNEAFPNTPENKAAVNRLVERLAGRTNVVLLHADLDLDDHSDVCITPRKGVYAMPRNLSPESNLAFQSEIVSGAEWFIGTYGGFSYLPLFYGVPSVTIYSKTGCHLPCHLEAAHRVAQALGKTNHFSYVMLEDLEQVNGLPQKENKAYAAS